MRLAEAHHLVPAALRTEHEHIEEDYYRHHRKIRQHIIPHCRLCGRIIGIFKRIVLRRYKLGANAFLFGDYCRHIGSECAFVGNVAVKIIVFRERVLIGRVCLYAYQLTFGILNGVYLAFLRHCYKLGIFDMLIIGILALQLRYQQHYQDDYRQIDQRCSQFFTQSLPPDMPFAGHTKPI